MGKKTVSVELYDKDGPQHYEGRCVGLIDDKEFNAIVSNTELQRKIATVETIPLVDIAKMKDVQELRLVVVKPDKTDNKKGLFITEPIELISQFSSPDDMTIVGTDGSYIIIKET